MAATTRPRWSMGLLLAAATLAASGEAALAQTAPSDRGRALVEQDCAECHATGPAGDSPNPAAPRFRDLGQRFPMDGLAQALAEGTVFGHPTMPPFKFAPDQVQAIIDYLKSIQVRQPS